MKYGDTLRQRSILAWQTHNIDYKDVKHYIKVNTTPGKGKAVSIPGSSDANAAEFEDSLFDILKEQDERITWFVRSKVGEIQRRLAHLEQQIARFQKRHVDLSLPGHTPVKQGRRYGKIETDILKVGEEIQALSRFVGVQLEGFRKLIKKYRKWTGSSELGYRFDDKVRQHGSSFSSTDLKPFLDKYEQLLHQVRSLYEDTQTPKDAQPTTPTKTRPTRADSTPNLRLQYVRTIVEKGARVDFDHTMATLKLGDHGKNAVFWVHPENTVELQILLLQYTRSFNAFCRQVSSISAVSSRSHSPTVGQSSPARADCFDIIVDNPHEYLARQASATVDTTEALPEAGIQRAALHARGNGKDEAAMLSWTQHSQYGAKKLETCAAKRKFVDTILNRGGSGLSRKASIPHLAAQETVADSSDGIERLQTWLSDHLEATPVTTVLSQRARFFNIAKNNSGAVLATLDHSISFQQGAWTELDGWPVSSFPHAVLQVRQEGIQSVDLIQVLDDSHLVERIPGFSLEQHAVWQATKPKNLTQPFWIPLLSQDLRKLPRPAAPLQKRSAEFGSQSTTPQLSTATSSEAGGNTDPRSGTDKILKGSVNFTEEERTGPKWKPKTSKLRQESLAPQQQYWNEYDNPSDDEEAYVIYLDPNEKSFFERVWSSLSKLMTREKREKAKRGETAPLLYTPDLESGSNEESYESSDDEDENDIGPFSYRTSRIYGPQDSAAVTEALARRSSAARAREAVASVPKFSMTCFLASATILIVAFLLAASGRRKLVTQVDAGVIFAVAASLFFSVLGVVNLYRSQEHLRGVVWAAAGAMLCLVAVASGGLLAWVVGDV